MKKALALLAFAVTAFISLACEPKPVDEPDEPQKENPKPGVYQFVFTPLADTKSESAAAAGVKTGWEEGDEILLTGGYAPKAITIKLKASEISADGRIASVQLDNVPDVVYGPDDFYAAWPAGMIESEDVFTNDVFDFNNTDALLMCAWLDKDNTFTFKHICSAISFTADGLYDGCVFAGNSWEMVTYDSWSVSVNSEYQDFRYGKGKTDYFLRKDLNNGSAALYFPGGISLSNGYTLYLRKGSSYPKIYKYDSSLQLKRGSILALGDITSKLQDYSGPAPELPTMPVMGKYTKYEVGDVPELSGICLTADHTALWAVGDNGWFGQISLDGKVTQWWKKSADLEGITLHPETGDLYLANEPYQVLRLKPPYDKPSSWEVAISVGEASKYGNSGMEGISYYKDDLLFVGTQTGANVWLYSINGEKRSEAVSLQKFGAGIKEVGGLCWDNLNHWLWVTDSETHKLFVIDEQLTHVLASYPVPYIHNNESVCVDHDHNCVWVGLDDDDLCCLYKIEFSGLDPR